MAEGDILARDAFLLLQELRLFWLIVVLYLLSFICYLTHLFTPESSSGRWARGLLVVGTLFHTLLIIFRTIEGQRPPFQTLYESLSWFAWSSIVTYLYIGRRWRDVHLRGPEITPLFPALQSQWFVWHVVLAFMSYAVFVVSFATEITYLLIHPCLKRGIGTRYGLSLASIERFHETAHRLVLFGFPLLTFGILSGAAWADEAWGRFWSWDPKETWSLITWTVFALYLHAMVLPEWRGKPASIFNILGFICMIMTFVGVSWLAKLLNIESIHCERSEAISICRIFNKIALSLCSSQ
jgi:ABC-type transport system involved in cytochrome c biogenesis permease subunit